MDTCFSLDHRWWLQFQPDAQNDKGFVCERLDANKSDATKDLQSNSITHSADQPTQNGCIHDHLTAPILSCSSPELTTCSNVQKCGQNLASVKVTEEMNGNDIHIASEADNCQGDVWTNNKLMDSGGLERSIDYYFQCANAKTFDKGGSTWRKADQRELASIVATKSAEHLQNCDLPPPQSVWLGGGSLKGSEKHKIPHICMPQDGSFVTYLDRPPHLEEKINSMPLSGYPSLSPTLSETTESTVGHKSSSDDYQERISRTSYSDGNAEPLESDYSKKLDVLEALRRSQTRAREAEKTAALVSLENEKLVSLCIREASHRNYYRQWLTLIEMENLKLRLQLKVLQSKEEGSVPCDSCKSLRKRKVAMQQEQCCSGDYQERRVKKVKKSKARKNVSWGLVVTLGLTLASAGLILGLSMGLIFPSL